jgi:hypothetical protein
MQQSDMLRVALVTGGNVAFHTIVYGL